MTTPATPLVIPAHEYRRVRWRNGAGWTREIHVEPTDATGHPHGLDRDDDARQLPWAWRLSIAEIDQVAAFSPFPGMRRALALLRGDALTLQFDDGERHALTLPLARLEFDGGRTVEATPGEGVTHVFNAIWDPHNVDVQLLHRPLVGPMVFFARPGEAWALHLLSGQARFDAAANLPQLAAGDTVLLRSGTPRRWLLDGGGELLALRIGTPPSAP